MTALGDAFAKVGIKSGQDVLRASGTIFTKELCAIEAVTMSIKLCKNCKHYEPRKVEAICNHKSATFNPGMSVVTGELEKPFQLECKTHRLVLPVPKDRCGPDAIYFEERKNAV